MKSIEEIVVIDAVLETDEEIKDLSLAKVESNISIVSLVDEIVANIQARIAKLDLKNIKATEDNKRVIKKLRETLSKEKQGYEKDIKTLRDFVNRDFNILNEQKKLKIDTLYTKVIKEMDDKLAAITKIQLEENTQYAKTYHANLLKARPITIGNKYEDVPWKFKFDSSKKSIMATADAHFDSIESSMSIIDNHEYKTQLLELFIESDYDLKTALVKLQQQITLAEKLMEDKVARQKVLEAELESKILVYQETLEQEVINNISKEEEVKKVPVAEEIVDYFFKVELTNTQLIDFIAFLEDSKIDYELVE